MTSFQKRRDKWLTQFLVAGRRKSKSFSTNAHTQSWALMLERQVIDATLDKLSNLKVQDLATRHINLVCPAKLDEKWKVKRLNTARYSLSKNLAKAMADELNFHNLHREPLTRLSEKFEVLTLAKIAPHSELSILKVVYNSRKIELIADTLGELIIPSAINR